MASSANNLAVARFGPARFGSGPLEPKLLRISRRSVERILEHARSVAPEEACGILSGTNDTVADVHEAENTLHSPVEYFMNPQDQIRIVSEIFDRDLDDLAYYHSHPASEPYPSVTDVNKVVIGRARMVIVTLREDVPQLRSFFVEDGRIEEEEVKITDEMDGE